MGFLKNRAIKAVTKKRFDQLVSMIENDPRLGEEGEAFDPMETLRDYIKCVELSGGAIETPPDITNWWELFIFLLLFMVQAELAYDPTMGSEQDLNLIMETANKQLEKWKSESVVKKFIRRERLFKKADKFIK